MPSFRKNPKKLISEKIRIVEGIKSIKGIYSDCKNLRFFIENRINRTNNPNRAKIINL